MSSTTTLPDRTPFTLDAGTLFALALAFGLMPSAQLLASLALPKTTPRKYYWLFLWHAYDFLNHFVLEACFLYHCFFSYIELPAPTSDYPHPASRGLATTAYLYNRSDRRYGPFYSQAPMARLWQEYAKADRRWGEADLTVISLELLTVFIAGPTAVYICYQIHRFMKTSNASKKAQIRSTIWFAAVALATGELYGGFMTFAPEWLSGNTNLDTANPIYLWLYLTFFNTLWVWFPIWILYEGYNEISAAFTNSVSSSKKKS